MNTFQRLAWPEPDTNLKPPLCVVVITCMVTERAYRPSGRFVTARWARVLLGVVVLASLLVAPGTGTASAQTVPQAEQEFMTRINQLRTSKGLAPLTVDNELHRVAVEWAGVMKAKGEIFHAEDLSVGVSANWAKLGENVGVGGDVGSLHEAFVASPGHYANLVDPKYTRIGVGVVRDGSRIFTAHRFMALQGGDSPAPTSPPATAPPTTPPTTLAPAPVPTPTAPILPPPTKTPSPTPTTPPSPTTAAPTTAPPTTRNEPTPTTTRRPSPGSTVGPRRAEGVVTPPRRLDALIRALNEVG